MNIPTFSTYLHLSNWDARVAKVAQEMGCNREMAQDVLLRRVKAQKKHNAAQTKASEKQQRIDRYQAAQRRMLGEPED
jgi:hypothetical protein